MRAVTGRQLAADGLIPDLICAGFPCQDISIAGKGAGIDGPRSGLWAEFARIIGEIRPRFVIVENVADVIRLRPLTTLPGQPSVLVAFHPTKNAGEGELIPFGSSATYNEIDG